jgi:hypothetical protein
VSSETPAAHLARLKVQNRGWMISRNPLALPGADLAQWAAGTAPRTGHGRSSRLIENALDFASVDVESAGYGALAVTGVVLEQLSRPVDQDH